MQKYRRFAGNLKAVCASGVRNARSEEFFAPSPAASIGHFGRHGFHIQTGGVTVPSRNDGAFSLILSERT
jgi:hypothetical protein